MKKIITIALVSVAITASASFNRLVLTPVAGTPPQVKVENISKQTLSYRLEWSTNMVNWNVSPGVRTIGAYSTQWIMPGVGDYSPLFFRVVQQ